MGYPRIGASTCDKRTILITVALGLLLGGSASATESAVPATIATYQQFRA